MAELSEKLLKKFRKQIHERASEIDPDNEFYWKDLTYGWALAQGLEPEAAREFASYVRYNTDMG